MLPGERRTHDLGYASWIGSVLYKSCTASHKGRLDDLDDLQSVHRDLPGVTLGSRHRHRRQRASGSIRTAVVVLMPGTIVHVV